MEFLIKNLLVKSYPLTNRFGIGIFLNSFVLTFFVWRNGASVSANAPLIDGRRARIFPLATLHNKLKNKLLPNSKSSDEGPLVADYGLLRPMQDLSKWFCGKNTSRRAKRESLPLNHEYSICTKQRLTADITNYIRTIPDIRIHSENPPPGAAGGCVVDLCHRCITFQHVIHPQPVPHHCARSGKNAEGGFPNCLPKAVV